MHITFEHNNFFFSFFLTAGFYLSPPVARVNNMCKTSADLQQQPLEGQAGVPARQAGVAERLGRGQAQLQQPAVALQRPRAAPEQLHVGAELLWGDSAWGEGKNNGLGRESK